MHQKHVLIRIAFIIVNLVLFAACISTPEAPQEISPLGVSADLPGVHLAYATNPPQGYQAIFSPNEIYGPHANAQDIWFFADPVAMNNLDPDGGLQAWLTAIDALQFPLEQASLFWIPAEPETDRLAFAEQNGLTSAINPVQQANLWRQQGDRLRTEGAFDASILAYQRSLTLDQTDPEAFAGLGAAYLGQGRNEASLPVFQNAIELAPNHYWAHRLLGNAYLNLQRYALAADEFTQAYILNPQDTHLLLGMALGQGRSGDRAKAIRTLDMLFSRTDDPQLLQDAQLLLQEFTSDTQ